MWNNDVAKLIIYLNVIIIYNNKKVMSKFL